MKIYRISASINTGGTITASQSDSGFASQYQEVILRLTISDPGAYDAFCPIVHLSSPNDPDPGSNAGGISDSDYESKFKYRLHMIPVGYGSYELHLNEAIGRHMKIGVRNECKYVIELLAHNPNSGEYESLHQTLVNNMPNSIYMYATNADYSDRADDLSNAFAMMNSLRSMIEE